MRCGFISNIIIIEAQAFEANAWLATLPGDPACQPVVSSGSGTVFILKVFARRHESQFSERPKKQVLKDEVPTQRHIQPQDFTLASHLL